ncbi:MAG: histidine phosphatase family protein [Kiloniellaceae bacterium]
MILVRHGQSRFNVVYGATRQDPGIVDPGLTEEGVRQSEEVAELLATRDVRRILASPYTRTLHTAEILAERLGLSVAIEPLVRERAFFVCDIGSPRSDLAARWPAFDFGDLPERWWPEPEEAEHQLLARCAAFRAVMAATADWPHVVVVSHWGFIRGLTGQAVGNGAVLPFRPIAD